MRLTAAYAIGLFLGFFICFLAHASPPPADADPALAPWFQSLHTKEGVGCCSVADCKPVSDRVVDGHYEALIEGKRLAVPPDKILNAQSNPTGHSVACYLPSRGIMCFVRATES